MKVNGNKTYDVNNTWIYGHTELGENFCNRYRILRVNYRVTRKWGTERWEVYVKTGNEYKLTPVIYANVSNATKEIEQGIFQHLYPVTLRIALRTFKWQDMVL